MTKVSIIIPIYNAQEYLEKCLDSIINQTLKDIEIICVDDFSKDNSITILNNYAQKDKRIKIIQHKENKGESAARNTGIEAANGEYLAFVDNDDIVDLDFYEKLYNAASLEQADIAKADAKETYYDGKTTIRSINKKLRETNCKYYFIGDWWTAIYKRDFINKNNIRLLEGYPLGGDILFVNKAVIAANKIATVDGTYYHHLMREDSGDSKYCSMEKIKSALAIFNQIVDNANEADICDKNPEGYVYIFSNHLIGAFYRAFRNKEQECKQLCAKATLEIYNKCKLKHELELDIIKEKCEFLVPFLQENNLKDITHILTISPNMDRFRIEILRDGIKRSFKKSNV